MSERSYLAVYSRCNVVQCGTVCCNVLQRVEMGCRVFQCGVLCCSGLQCEANASCMSLLFCDESTSSWVEQKGCASIVKYEGAM